MKTQNAFVWSGPKTCFKRRISLGSNSMQMSNNHCSMRQKCNVSNGRNRHSIALWTQRQMKHKTSLLSVQLKKSSGVPRQKSVQCHRFICSCLSLVADSVHWSIHCLMFMSSAVTHGTTNCAGCSHLREIRRKKIEMWLEVWFNIPTWFHLPKQTSREALWLHRSLNPLFWGSPASLIREQVTSTHSSRTFRFWRVYLFVWKSANRTTTTNNNNK